LVTTDLRAIRVAVAQTCLEKRRAKATIRVAAGQATALVGKIRVAFCARRQLLKSAAMKMNQGIEVRDK
jgi:hypothetical protein